MGANAQTSVPTFTTGQVLTAAQQNLINTGVPVAAGTAERDGLFGGSGEKTLAEGQLCYLESTNVVQYYDGAAWATVGPSTPGGLVFLTGAAFTTQTSVSLPNSTFTSTYRNYRMIWTISAVTSDADFTMRLRASGSDNTTANYGVSLGGITTNTSAFLGTSSSDATSWTVGEQDATLVRYVLVVDVLQPQVAAFTYLVGNLNYVNKAASSVIAQSGTSSFLATTAFDSLTFISSVASSITGTYRVYGYTDS
jgi:hypothetical protein